LNFNPSYILPNQGSFTSHAKYVPCLLSGTAVEYDRVRNLLIESLKNHQNHHWSDLFAMEDLFRNSPEAILYTDKVMSVHQLPKEDSAFGEVCSLSSQLLAVHFSRYAVSVLGYSLDEQLNRHHIMNLWTQKWTRYCHNV